MPVRVRLTYESPEGGPVIVPDCYPSEIVVDHTDNPILVTEADVL